MEKQIILIAGGTGLIGNELEKMFEIAGHEVRILSRQSSDASKNIFHWNPAKKEIDLAALKNVSTIVNLSGAGIADKRWTDSRKKELIDSRVDPALFLASFAPEMKYLKQYISSSGINAYGYIQPKKVFVESDSYGKDFLSQVVKKWEEAADVFQAFCPVAKIRTSVVLSKKGGALETIEKPMHFGIASAIGTGKQWMPWIHTADLCGIFQFVMNHRLEGNFNAVSEMVTNQEFTEALAKQLDKKMWAPNAPAFMLKLALGEMSSMVLEGLNATSDKIKEQGFVFKFEKVADALADLRGK